MRRLRWLLIASIAANIFLAGVIGGGLWRWHRAEHGPAMLGSGQRWRLRAAGSLSTEHGAQLRQALRQTIQGAQPVIAEARAARRQAAALLTAPSYDAHATMMALDRARAADFTVRQRLEARIVTLASGLPADERASLAAALSRPRRRPPPQNGGEAPSAKVVAGAQRP